MSRDASHIEQSVPCGLTPGVRDRRGHRRLDLSCIAADIAASSFCGGAKVFYEIDGICLLLAATIKRAQFDAKRGDKAAQRWLKRFLDGVKC